MDVLTNKTYGQYDYNSRYAGDPVYFNTVDNRYISGIGQNLNPNTAWVAHEVRYGDTADKLALKYYNNPTLWWAIAYFNQIFDAFEPLQDQFRVVKIPQIASIKFEELR